GALDGTYTIGMASRELKEEETAEGAAATVLAMDGIAVVVNPANPIENLTVDQIKSIYVGETTVWSELQ
ncbi:substrate-binding domain-containing protein, partial [uncultured Subdoligranulum sp.]